MTAPKKLYAGEQLSEYDPPVLFPRIGQFHDPDDQREYVKQMIEQMAREGRLCLTDMLAQPSRIRNLCGRIIKGIRINPDSMREERAEPLAPDVLACKVRIKAIGDAKTVKFKHGVVRDPRRTRSLAGGSGAEIGISQDPSAGWSRRMVPMVDEVWDYQTDLAEMDLDAAWICLGKSGEHCCHKPPMLKRAKYWLYREVDVNGEPMIKHLSDPKVEQVDGEVDARQPRRQRG